MKNPKKPTVRQRKLIESYRNYNSDNWLINKDTSSEMHIIHRKTETKKFYINKNRGFISPTLMQPLEVASPHQKCRAWIFFRKEVRTWTENQYRRFL